MKPSEKGVGEGRGVRLAKATKEGRGHRKENRQCWRDIYMYPCTAAHGYNCSYDYFFFSALSLCVSR